MDHGRFWSLIDEARAKRGRTSAALLKALTKLPPAEIAAFDAWFWAYYMATSREDLWAAVYAIRGGCGDDSFGYFRCWLIGRGEDAVLSAIRDPESLVEIIGKADPSDEAMLGAARMAYREVKVTALPDAATVAIPNREAWPTDRFESGLKWNDAFFAANYPKLYARYLEPHHKDEPTGSITDDRFWQIIDDAKERAATAQAAARELEAILRELPREELIGFDRWLGAYNYALMRKDVQVACRIVLGKDDPETAAGLRGWLIAQGRAAVAAVKHDLDTVLEVAKHPPASCVSIIFITGSPLQAHDIYRMHSEDEREAIPDLDTWRADFAITSPSVAELRARFPRLTAGMTDEELGGPADLAKLTDYERGRVAASLLERANATTDDREKLELLDSAAKASPLHEEVRTARGRLHARLGNSEAALSDFDAALARSPGAAHTRFERARLRHARGDHAGALADAREAAHRVPEARTWIESLAPGTPRRVRHTKFGDGAVVSIDKSGSEVKLVIDFADGRKTIAMRFVEVIA
ncbi:MAG: DUF4240 domain-containing protein [Deltaproteobacteria bacterium]|nr:DUF4240 domain-containing protein [Deltaproteobacteria bacterium]